MRRAFEKESDRHLKNKGDVLQAARANAVRAFFVFLHLLECKTQRIGKLFLAHFEHQPTHSHPAAHMSVDRVRGLLGHCLDLFHVFHGVHLSRVRLNGSAMHACRMLAAPRIHGFGACLDILGQIVAQMRRRPPAEATQMEWPSGPVIRLVSTPNERASIRGPDTRRSAPRRLAGSCIGTCQSSGLDHRPSTIHQPLRDRGVRSRAFAHHAASANRGLRSTAVLAHARGAPPTRSGISGRPAGPPTIDHPATSLGPRRARSTRPSDGFCMEKNRIRVSKKNDNPVSAGFNIAGTKTRR